MISTVSAWAECTSQRFSDTESQVMSAYIAYYGRMPDSAGLAFWSDQLDQQGSLDAIIQAFGTSDEFERNFGALDHSALVNNLYQQAFGRDADPAGLAFYVDELDNNRLTLQSVALFIVGGAQNEDDDTISNRITASSHYVTAALDDGVEFSESQMTGLLSSIDENPETTEPVCASITMLVEEIVAEQNDDSEFFASNACDNGDSGNEPVKKIGTVKGIKGLAYSSESFGTVNGIKKSIQGVTGVNGEFEYFEVCGEAATTLFCLGVKKGCSVSDIASGITLDVSLGGRILGRIVSTEEVVNIRSIVAETYPEIDQTTQNLVTSNIYRLLLTLDIDRDGRNGIVLNASTRTMAELYADGIDFTDDEFANNQSVINYVTDVTGQSDLASEADANSFEEALQQVVDTYAVSGSILGSSGPVTLILNDEEEITTELSSFAFSTRLTAGENYSVNILSEPQGQTCVVTRGQGVIEAKSVADVQVICESDTAFSVSVFVQGANEDVGLSLNNGSTVLFANGVNAFPVLLESGDTYTVSLVTAPVNQVCSVTNGVGVVENQAITDVSVICDVDPADGFTVGGQITGANSDIALRLNGGIAFVFSNGAFSFNQKLQSGTTYSVSLVSEPAGQSCEITNGSGSISASNITNVSILCDDIAATEQLVGGNISGLSGAVELTLNGASSITISSNGSFQFSDVLLTGESYSVTVTSQPNGQSCSVGNSSGTIANVDVTNVNVDCDDIEETFSIGGTVNGAIGTVAITLNGSTSLFSTGGDFQFPQAFANGSSYQVTAASVSGDQVCEVQNGGGSIAGANVTNVIVSCTPTVEIFSVSVSISGAVEDIVVSLNGEHETTSGNGSFEFDTVFTAGDSYVVAIVSDGTSQACTASNSSGTITGNVTVAIQCVSNEPVPEFTVGGSVSGLTGSASVTLNGAETITISEGEFTFTELLLDNQTYSVTLASIPDGFTCAITNSSGVINGANVTNILVNCDVIELFSVNVNLSGASEPVIVSFNGGDNITLSNGVTLLADDLESGDAYTVQLVDEGTDQVCEIADNSGQVSNGDVTVLITCEAVTGEDSVNLDGQGTDNTAVTIDASSGAIVFSDAFAVGNNVRIANFGADDTIVFTGTSQSLVEAGFTTDGSNARVTLNNNGIVSQVVFVGVGGSVFTVQQFNALGVGDIVVSP
ncbi:hypothetical protein OLMES_0923 [Oleiphilus messinensis]|uniref:DUF4214 domain-containing protein n=2 Tax=Oleiphilus messinensis TaxID=141451 RepID=A0A1Y0I446_9GAMM|nr:hypothetical protein OLMES_0923 [Oleiphilus messinensis]